MKESELIRLAMSALGKRSSSAKSAAARANGSVPRPPEKRKGWPKGKKRKPSSSL